MEPDRWQRIQSLFDALVQLDARERPAAIDHECASDPELRRIIEGMLHSEALEDDFLVSPFEEMTNEVAPRVLGEFEIMEEIGRGGMGVVYRARQKSLDRIVAVKVLPQSWCQSERQIERFDREARSAARLHHPGIVTVFANGRLDDLHYFAMEFVDGPNLAQLLKFRRSGGSEGGPDWSREAEWLAEPASLATMLASVADALQVAHEAGIVHRDIKPSNLLFAKDGRLKVSDFGLVRDEQSAALSATGEVLGSPHYVSPEQARGSSTDVDARTDVYSLGVVLFEALTGRRPFQGDQAAEVLRQVAEGDPPRVRSMRPSVPVDLATICETAMAQRPEDRYASAAKFAEDLRRAAALEPVLARPVRRRFRAARWLRQRRSAILIAAAALVVGGGVMGGVLIAGDKTQERITWSVAAPNGLTDDARAFAWLQEIDPLTGCPGEQEREGVCPLEFSTDPGYYRLTIRVAGHTPLEFDRYVAEGSNRLEISPGSLLSLGSRKDMVRLAPAPVRYERKDALDPPAIGADLKIAPFWLDRFEVSNAEYLEFVRHYPECTPLVWKNGMYRAGADDLPVVSVSPEHAQRYAEWRGKRLPTVAELLYAGRGPNGRLFPWTESVEVESYRGACHGNPSGVRLLEDPLDYYYDNVAAVNSHSDAATELGIHHLLGNVGEITSTLGLEWLTDGTPEALSDSRMILGGAWDAENFGIHLGNSSRSIRYYVNRDIKAGFRCARSD